MISHNAALVHLALHACQTSAASVLPNDVVATVGQLRLFAVHIRKGDYLEVVEFSSFQIDEVSGDMAGEIRLGYLHQDGQVMIVSGGSVSGNMSDFIGSIRFSRETRQYDNYLIPAVTRLKNVSVAGGPDT